MIEIVNRMVFGGNISQYINKIKIYHNRDTPPGTKEVSWSSDGLRGMYDKDAKTARICIKSFYGTWLWAMAHDLCHVHDIAYENLTLFDDGSVLWMGYLYAPIGPKWKPYETKGTPKLYKEFGDGIFQTVIRVADEHVPWEVKPSVMAEVCLMELRGQQKQYRRNFVK